MIINDKNVTIFRSECRQGVSFAEKHKTYTHIRDKILIKFLNTSNQLCFVLERGGGGGHY